MPGSSPQATPTRRSRFGWLPLEHLTRRKIINLTLGTLLVLGGLGAALLTGVASRAGYPQLVSLLSAISLLSIPLMLLFVVPPLLRSARAELGWLDFGIGVTKGGLIFAGMLLIVGFAAWNTGNNLLFMVLSLLISMTFVGFSAARTALRELIVSARFPDHIFAGEPAPVIVTLRNKKMVLPSFSILVGARTKSGSPGEGRRKGAEIVNRPLAYFVHVPHRAAAEQRVEHVFPQRGHLVVTGFELTTRFPFGLLSHRRRLRARDVDIVVYPKPEPIDDALHLLPMNAGRFTAARAGAGHELLRLRDYQPQDDLRRMDWKATARTGGRRMIVREYMAEDERRVHVALNTARPADADAGDFAKRFERGVTLAASLVAHFIRENAEVQLTLGEEKSGYGTGPDHLYHSLRRLALVRPGESSADAPRLDWDTATISATGPGYIILLTTAAPGTIPAHLWRRSHVIYL